VSEGLLHRRLAATADSYPDRVAVVDGERSLTYAQLELRSNQIAHVLRDAGVVPGSRVALYLDKSAEAVTAIYGIMKAGAAYVPLDPQSPEARLGLILDDCSVSCLISSVGKTASLDVLAAEGAVPPALLIVDGDTSDAEAAVGQGHVLLRDAVDAAPAEARPASVSEDDLAYILYTSGSTGNPKGVMLSHLNALAFVDWGRQTFGVGPDDRLSSHAPFHFDLSVFDLYAASTSGAALVLVPAGTSVLPVQVRRFIEGQQITVWYSVPSVLSMLAIRGGLHPGDLPDLRVVLFAGEVFPTKYLRNLMSVLPEARFANLYGPTETNVCTWYDVPPLDADDDETIPIGRPIDGVDAFGVDDEGGVVPVGGRGELFVTGPTVAHGYWNDEERTTRGFVSDPRGIRDERCYRTGDLVELLPDGSFRFFGRIDAQVKSRGYRIELGEIETALISHDNVVECAVVAIPDELVTNRLKAFVVTKADLSAADLLHYCAERVPHYMVPETITVVDDLPRTSTGKIDRRGLLSAATSD
jgi:amino acid adenylation domain-containing protein